MSTRTRELDGVALAYATTDVEAILERFRRHVDPDPLWTVTIDDLALNAVQDALEAGRRVHYRGSLEECRGWRVSELERCGIDCCLRRQALVRVHGPEGQASWLRHVSAEHLAVLVQEPPTESGLRRRH